MTKKIFIALTLLWLIFGITKVKALSRNEKIDIIKENLEIIIQIKDGNIWEDLNLEKYNKGELIIYKLGNNNLDKNEITVGTTFSDNKIKRVINSKKREEIFLESGVNTENDKYMATKIAIDIIQNNISNEYKKGEVLNNYRPKEGLNEAMRARANNIIQAAEELVNIGYTGTEKLQNSISLYRIGELTKDDINKDYSSQEYEVRVEYGNLLGYKIIEKGNAPINYYISNIYTNQEQEIFGNEETKFKIMVPEEEIKEIFKVNIKVEVSYETEAFLEGTDGINKYIILSKENKKNIMDAQMANRYSKLSLNFIDKETGKNIHGCIVEIQDNIYEINKDNQEIINNILKSDVEMKIIHIPENYYIENTNYLIEINHKKNHLENIVLNRKKGNLDITTTAKEATYEIYDDEQRQIGTYETNEEGKVYIENIDIGNYTIKQTKVKDGYKLIGDITVPILYNETCYVTIVNPEEEKKPEEPEIPKEENRKDEVEIDPPKEDQKVELPEKTENPAEDKEQDKRDELEEEKTDKIEKPKEDKVQEKIENPKKEEAEIPKEEKKQKQEIPKKEEINNSNILLKKEEKIETQTLPRTGNDYFVLKILLADLSIFLIIVVLLKIYSNKKTRLSKEQVTKKI